MLHIRIKRKYKHCISIQCLNVHEVSYVSHMFNMRNFKKLILHIECFLSYKISTIRALNIVLADDPRPATKYDPTLRIK